MEYKYIPDVCKGEDAEFEGHIMLKGLHFDKRMELMDEMNANKSNISDMQGLAKNPENIANVDVGGGMKFMKTMVDNTKSCWSKVSLKHKESGAQLQTLEDVLMFTPAHGILMEVANHVVSGGMGKKKGT